MSIKIGTVIKAEEAPGEQIRRLAPLGFESFAVMFWQTLGGADLPLMADEVRRAAEETGTAVSAVCLYGNPLLGDAMAEETRLGVDALIANARLFGTDLLGCFAGRVKDRPIEESIGPWKSVFSEHVKRAEANGVKIAMENCRMGGATAKVGDTVTTYRHGATEALTGYREPKPMVYSGLYPVDGSDYPNLRDALDKLQLNDAALTYEPETSVALGFGFRCGFLGLLHMEITRERLEREFDLDLISTSPNVVYRVIQDDGTEKIVTNPSDWPEGKVREVYEPVVKTTVIAPSEFIGTIMELCQSRRGELGGMDYLSPERVELRYTMPLGEIIFDFFDSLKSRTRGYASLDYEEAGEQEAALVKVDILLQGEAVDAFSAIVHKDSAAAYGNKMTTKLKELIPRQQFEVPVQAAIGSKIIARENIRAIRKDVLAKCYGGDITRKRKLLEKQKEGKKRMKTIGRVDVPQEAFVAALSTDSAPDKTRK